MVRFGKATDMMPVARVHPIAVGDIFIAKLELPLLKQLNKYFLQYEILFVTERKGNIDGFISATCNLS